MENKNILMVQEEDGLGVYATFTCPDDNSKDYLLLSDINKITLDDEVVEEVFEASFNLSYSDSNPHYVKLCASTILSNGIAKSESIDICLQELTDEFIRSVYNDESFDYTSYMNGKKKEVSCLLAEKMFIEEGVMLPNTEYPFVGIAYSSSDKKIGLVNSFSCKNVSEHILSLNGVISYISLRDLVPERVVFNTSKASITINVDKILTATEGMTKSYHIKSGDIVIDKMDCEIGIKSISGLDDMSEEEKELFFDERIGLIDSKEDIIMSNSDVDNMFEDFDF